MAIPSYREELEQGIHLPDGQSLLLRPIRPDDKGAYVRLFQSLSPEDIFMRFLGRMLKLCRAMGFRLQRMSDEPGVILASLAL